MIDRSASSPVVRHRGGLVLSLAVGLIAFGPLGCTSAIDTPTAANLEMSATPTTVTAVPSANAEYTWTATVTITLTETAGTSAAIEQTSANIVPASGGVPIDTTDVATFSFGVMTATDAIPALGTNVFRFTIDYTLPNAGREALLTVAVSAIDAENNVRLIESVQVSVL